MKCAVVVMATLMITASILLVGVSLAMAEHIDELGITDRHILFTNFSCRFVTMAKNKKHFEMNIND